MIYCMISTSATIGIILILTLGSQSVDLPHPEGPRVEGGPMLHKNLGIVISPTPPFYAPTAFWTHIVKINLPCIQQVLPLDTIIQLEDSQSIVRDLLDNLKPDRLNSTQVKVRTMLVQNYKYLAARIHMLKRALQQLTHRGQYAWGLLESSTCAGAFDHGGLNDMDTSPDDEFVSRMTRSIPDEGNTMNSIPGSLVLNRPTIYEMHIHSAGATFYRNDRRPNNGTSDYLDDAPIQNPIARGYPQSRSIPPQLSNSYQSTRRQFDSIPSPINNVVPDKYQIPSPSKITTRRPFMTITQAPDKSDELELKESDFKMSGDMHPDSPLFGIEMQDHTMLSRTLQRFVSDDIETVHVKVCELADRSRESKCIGHFMKSDKAMTEKSRSRRSICDFCGNIMRELYGTATRQDVISALSAMKSDFSTFSTKVNNLMSQQLDHSSKLNSSLATLEIALRTLSGKFSAVKDIATALSKTIEGLNTDVQMSSYLTYIDVTLATMTNLVNVARDASKEIESFYRSVKSSIQNRYLDVELLSSSDLKTVVANLTRFIPANYDWIPTWENSKFLDTRSISLLTSDHDLLLILKIPLIYKTRDYRSWTFTALPFSLTTQKSSEGSLYASTVVDLPMKYAAFDLTGDYWFGLDDAEWASCVAFEDNICPHLVQWNTISKSDCVPSLVLNGLSPKEIGQYCSTKIMFLPAQVQTKVIDPKHWLISVVGPPQVAYEQCHTQTESTPATSAQVHLSGLSLFEIEVDCKVSIAHHIFRGIPTLESSSMSMILDPSSSSVLSGLGPIRVEKLDGLISSNSLSTLNELIRTTNITRGIFDNEIASIDSIRRAMASGSKINLISANTDHIDEAIEKLRQDGNFFSLPAYLKWIGLTLMTGIILLAMVKIWRICRPSQLPLTAAAVPLASLPTKSFALNVTLVNSTILSHDDTLNKTLFQLQNAMAHPSVPFIQLMLGLIMMLIMLYCLYQQHTYVHPLLSRILLLQSIFPLNRHGAHHLGEAPIVITVLCEFVSMLGTSIKLEIGCQATTLPNPGNQWLTKSGSDGRKAITRRSCYRYQWWFKIPINWRDICIVSTLDNIETCSDMPSNLGLPWIEIKNQIGQHLPFLWWRVTPICVTQVFVGQGPQRRMIFSYLSAMDSKTTQ